jgi:hypothetical protein
MRDGEKRIKAWPTAAPGLVIHQTWISIGGYLRCWTLTHAPTGMAICENFRSREDAAECAEKLGRLPIDWTNPDREIVVNVPPDVRKAVVDIVRTMLEKQCLRRKTEE